MMRFNNVLLLSLVGSFLLFACIRDLNQSSDGSETAVTFVDHGAVVPDPVTTTVTIDMNSIEYETAQSGAIIEQWSEEIESLDYNSVQQIIEDYDLLQITDITLEQGEMPCTGWGGMGITIECDGSSNSFNISGDVCSRQQWPEGVRLLVDLKDELVAKYKQ